MGLFGALTASVAGLSVQGQAISVISDNLANTNTTGYKASRSVFDQLVTGSGVSGTSYNAGGVQATTQRDQAAQGSLSATSSTTDLAISGNGYFRVASDANPSSNTSYYYTRAGSFSPNKAGYLVDPNGMYLQGWATDSEGNISNLQDLVNINTGSVGVSAEKTTSVKISANLDSGSTAETALYDTSAGLSSSLNNVLGSTDSNIFTTDVRVYDAQGNARDLNMTFSKRADNTWDYQVTTDGSNLQGGTTGTQTRISSGTLTFNTDGTLQDVTTTDPTTGAVTQGATLTAAWSGGVDPSNLTLDLGAYTGGTAVTAASSGLSFNSGVLATSVQNSAMPTGTYTMKVTGVTGGVASLELDDSSGTAVATATMSTASSARTVVFTNTATNTKLQVNVSSNFNADPTPGAYPTTVATGTSDATLTASGATGVTVNNTAMPVGAYSLQLTAAGTGNLIGPGGAVVASGVTIPASGDFTITGTGANSNVNVTINATAFTNTAGAYPATAGGFTVADTTTGTKATLGTMTVGTITPSGTGSGTDGIVQYATDSNVSATTQDGFGSGLLSGIAIGSNGDVSGTFTNGETKILFKVALGVFQNQDGLEPVSGSLLKVTDASGAALIKEPGVGGTGSIDSGELEGSTTDIAGEFSNMIVAQRAFQANSSVIQTVDQMLNTLLQIR